MKESNKKRKLQHKTPVAAYIRIYVSNEDEKKTTFFNVMDKAKLCVDENISSVSIYTLLNKALGIGCGL